MENLIFDFENYGIYFNFILIFYICFKTYQLNLISKEVFCLIIISCLGPILFNYIPEIRNIFPDQGGYFDNIKSFRENHDFDTLRHSENNKFLSLMLSVVPIPSVGTLYSASFINKFIIIFFLIYLLKFKYVDNTQTILLLLYPSLFLYSSLMLKEITIIFFLTLSYLFMMKKKFIFCLICLGLTFLIKPYLSVLFAIIYILYFHLILLKPKFEYLIFVSFLIFLVLLLKNDLVISQINKLNIFIYNFHLEGSGYSRDALDFTKNLLKFDFESFSYIIKAIVSFWVKPIIYEVKNLPQLFQSLENIFVIGIFIYYLKKLYKKDIIKTYYIILSMIIVSTPYAIIVANIGTLSRYRFTIVVIFLLIIFAELNQFKKNEKT